MVPPTPTDPPFQPLTGHCSCGALAYTLTAPPLITHCCHCTWCQRESGSAFGLNSIIESSHFHLSHSCPQPVLIPGPTPSGSGQHVGRCPVCYDGLFKYYGEARHVTFVKTGTLDEESFRRVGDRVQIFTSTKAGWVDLEGERERGVGVFEGYYVREEVWSREALERRERLMALAEEEKRKEGPGKDWKE